VAIKRLPLSTQVRSELLERMRTGKVRPGDSINEIQLAEELGVSRTPLREALVSLESEGQIASESGKGFHYRKLSAKEFRELTPIVAQLECLALELSAVADLKRLSKQLIKSAKGFKLEDAEYQLIATKDDEWHELMLSACPNTTLLTQISKIRLSLHRYESLLVTEKVVVHRVATEHLKIAEYLQEGDIGAAQQALRDNWSNSVDRILERANIRYLAEDV